MQLTGRPRASKPRLPRHRLVDRPSVTPGPAGPRSARALRGLQRGQVLVVFAIGLLGLLAAAAITIDLGMWLSERRTLQNAADAGAQAGISELLKRPITADKQERAVEHALRFVNLQLGLGLSDDLIAGCAAAAASDPAGDGLGPEDCDGRYPGPTRVVIRSPVGAGDSCRGTAWGERAITVRLERPSGRFFSRIFSSGDPMISACATAAVNGGSLAVAVLKPNRTGPNTYDTQPDNATITMKIAGSDTFVRIWGGDVAVNSLFSAAGAPPPQSPNEPAYVKFMTAGPTGISDNRMYLTIDQPSPMTWSVDARQIRTEGLTPDESDDPYHEPRHLPAYVPIPGWGNTAYAALLADEAARGVTPQALTVTSSTASTGSCTSPLPGAIVLAPGAFSLLDVGTNTTVWLCPGVYHFFPKQGSKEGLQLGGGSVVAGQGVTLVFENDSALRIDSGAALLLNCQTPGQPACANPAPAPWTTGDVRHLVRIAIWIEPVPGCDPLAVACSDQTSSDVFVMSSGSGLDVRGLIYGPTDKMKIAGNGDHHGTGEIWAWTLEYLGNSTLDQTYEGSDDGYALLVE